ncbi:DUF418 domain-containing protein [Alkalicoccus daliensis]|nr:DUF418 domain-containing protein [Alkalicoccus daliensis]
MKKTHLQIVFIMKEGSSMSSVDNSVKGERIIILDRLRGFALLGIFLMNIPGLAGVSPDAQPVLRSFLEILMQDSARPLFAIMFGLSIALLYDKTKIKDKNPYPMLVRRLVILGIAGTIHAYAVWAGDILLMFAMGGFIMLALLKLSGKWLFVLGMSLWIFYTVGQDFYSNYLGISVTPAAVFGAQWESWKAIAGMTLFLNEFSSMLNHLGFFLLGIFIYRKEGIYFIVEHRLKMWLFSLLFFIVGFLGKTALLLIPDNLFIQSLQNFFPFVLTLGVAIGVVLTGTSRTVASKLLPPFTAVGRMTFTNYLLQSLVFTTVFTGRGQTIFQEGGIWTNPGYHFALSLGLLFFVFQMIFSQLWMKKFYYGPFEWIWRVGTYGKLVPMIRENANK